MREIILKQSKRANVGHIGSCLCVVEILCALYGETLRAISPTDRDRDRFVLSKGHAGLALYAALALNGWIPAEELDTFCGDNSILGVHPDAALTGVDFSTGSLGHGLSISVGAALAARLQGSARKAYCLISDAECNEGSVWEAVMFAAHHKLGNLRVIVDVNGQQAFGLTKEVLDISNLGERWAAFGWRVSEVDGHSVDQIAEALLSDAEDRPHVVLARTIFGKGVSYMEQGLPAERKNLPIHRINWHYLPMSDREYEMALTELQET
jgi:transketolase